MSKKVRNAEYFRKLQGIKPIAEQVEEDVKYVLDTIEIKITKGNLKRTNIEFSFNVSPSHGELITAKLGELGFFVYGTSHEIGTGTFKFTVDWGEI